MDGIADPAAPGEWVGLEETLELSMRERRASDGKELYSGEFSKVMILRFRHIYALLNTI